MDSSTKRDMTQSNQNIDPGTCVECGAQAYVITYCPHTTIITNDNCAIPVSRYQPAPETSASINNGPKDLPAN